MDQPLKNNNDRKPAISKSRFMGGRQCSRRLWLEVHYPALATPHDIETEFVFEQGHIVGEFAQKWRGAGELIELDLSDPAPSYIDTRKAIEAGVNRIYEAAFEYRGFRAFIDILERKEDGSWRVIEVKSTSRLKSIHVPDLAFQAWLARENGLDISEAGVVHLNRKATWPDQLHILAYSECSADVLEGISEVQAQAEEMMVIACSDDEPLVSPGKHCTNPYQCRFQQHCGTPPEPGSLYSLPRLNNQQRQWFSDNGYNDLADLPDDSRLREVQQHWRQAILSGQPYIDYPALEAWLAHIEEPVYSLDFETISYAIPRYHGLKPFQKIPFQFSCHKRLAPGHYQHSDYLHDAQSDPREPLLKALLESLGSEGTILAWNASFESSVIGQLAKAFPDFAKELAALQKRLLDPVPLFRKAYLHPQAAGSASLKAVGRAFFPDSDYSRLAVANGTQAFVSWHNWVFHGRNDGDVVKDLKAYCALDTELPLKILEQLEAAIKH